ISLHEHSRTYSLDVLSLRLPCPPASTLFPYTTLFRSVVANESRVGPVYITRDLLLPNTTNGAVTQWLTQSYQLVPQGLVFNLTTDRKSTRLNSSHVATSYAVFCLKKHI